VHQDHRDQLDKEVKLVTQDNLSAIIITLVTTLNIYIYRELEGQLDPMDHLEVMENKGRRVNLELQE
jgi:hypothetical protein